MIVKIYSKPNCPYCTRAKTLLKNKGIDYEELVLGVNFNREFLLELFPEAKTFPQISIDGKGIGGYEELVNLIK